MSSKATLVANRSMPESTVVPVLHYADVPGEVSWLCRAFGFTERLRIGSHRVQLNVAVGGGAVVIAQGSTTLSKAGQQNHSVMIRVMQIDEHYDTARAAGATILSPPTNYPYGERQYSAVDPEGHIWTFSQTLSDVDPTTWGGNLLTPS